MMFIAHTLVTLRDKLAAADKERGATMVEYGLLVALIAIVAIAGVILLGTALDSLFTDVAGRLP